MECNNQDFEEFKNLFKQEFGNIQLQGENASLFLSYINAQQMIIVANKMTEISITLKSIDEKLNKIK